MTEYENLMSRERKRRNKEKKAARMASLGIFAGQSPLSMLHPGVAIGLPAAPMAHFGEHKAAPLVLSIPDSRLEEHTVDSQFGPRRRRGISDTRAAILQQRLGHLTSPLPESVYHQSSVSQPPTPAQAYSYYQSLALPPAQHDGMSHVSAEYFSGPLSAPLMPATLGTPFFAGQPSTPGPETHSAYRQEQQEQQQQVLAFPHVVDLMALNASSSLSALPSSRASATDADLDLGLVDLLGLPTAVPTSAHVRPIDLPAPHGHFDFASVPFPTQDTFASEVPFTALRRRSSIHLPVGTADAFRRPSVAEVATAALMQKVAGKRTEKITTDVKQLTQELLATDSSGIVAWNAHVQSQMPASMAAWSGFHPSTSSAEVVQHDSSSDYVPPPAIVASRSNSDGLLSLEPLSPPLPLLSSGFVKADNGLDEVSATSSCSVSSSTVDGSLSAEVTDPAQSDFTAGQASHPFTPFPPGSSHPSSLQQEAWSGFRTDGLPLLSPVSELNMTFSSFNVLPPSTTASSAAPQGKGQDTLSSNSLSMAFGHGHSINSSEHPRNF